MELDLAVGSRYQLILVITLSVHSNFCPHFEAIIIAIIIAKVAIDTTIITSGDARLTLIFKDGEAVGVCVGA